jgi:protease secretion system outer membrane protein
MSAHSVAAEPEPPWALAEVFATQPDGLTAKQLGQSAAAHAPAALSHLASSEATRKAQDELSIAMAPRLDLQARYTRLSAQDNDPLVALGDAASLDAARALVGSVSDPAAQALLGGFVEQTAGLSNSAVPVFLNQFALRASVVWPVTEIFATLTARYDAVDAAAKAQAAQAEAARQEAAFRAKTAFYSAVRAKGLVTLAQRRIAQADAHLGLLRGAVAQGTATTADVLRVEAQRAGAQMAQSGAQAGLQSAVAALGALTGAAVSAELPLGEDVMRALPTAAPEVDALVQRAMQARPEAAALGELMKAHELSARAALGDQYPDLLIVGNLDVANPNPRYVPQREQFDATWDVSVVLQFSPNTLLTSRAKQEAAQAERRRAEADLRALEDGVRVEVSAATAQLSSAGARLGHARELVRAAEEGYRVRRALFEQGMGRAVEMLDADTERTAAAVEQLSAVIDGWLAVAQLERALGSELGSETTEIGR